MAGHSRSKNGVASLAYVTAIHALLRVEFAPAPKIVWIERGMQIVRDLADRVFVLHYGKGLAGGID